MSALLTLCKISHFSDPEDTNKQIASSILLNLKRIPGATIQDVAEFCYVSVATVSRFIRNAGYLSFAQFKQSVEQEMDAYNYLTHTNLSPAAALDATMESYIEQSVVMAHRLRNDLDRDAVVDIADAMYRKKEVFVFSFFFQSSLPYLQVDMNISGKRMEICEVEVDQRRVIDSLGPDSFLLVIKNQDADTRYMDDLVRQAKRQGAEIGMILNTNNSAILDCADYSLTFEGTGTPVDSAAMNDCVTLISLAYRKRYLTV